MTLQSLALLIDSLMRGEIAELDRLRVSQVWEPATMTRHNNVAIQWNLLGKEIVIGTRWTASPVPRRIHIAGKLRETVIKAALDIISHSIRDAIAAKEGPI